MSNPKSYILWDISRDARPGFGLKVSKKKTYILRSKVLGKSMLSKVGNFTDFDKIQDAWAKAAELARTMVETGQNPNALAQEANAAEVTLKTGERCGDPQGAGVRHDLRFGRAPCLLP